MGTYSFVNDVMHDAVLYTDRGVMSLFKALNSEQCKTGLNLKGKGDNKMKRRGVCSLFMDLSL